MEELTILNLRPGEVCIVSVMAGPSPPSLYSATLTL